MPSTLDAQSDERTRANPFRFYCLSILDKHHNPNISLDEGIKLLGMCTDELKRRLPIDYKGVSGTLSLSHTAVLTRFTGPGEGGDQGRRQGGGL